MSLQAAPRNIFDLSAVAIGFTPPSVGRWRATAAYRGTRGTAPSEGGFARFLVAAPLHD